jgi:hypothetical protein
MAGYDQSVEISAFLNDLIYLFPPPDTNPETAPTVRSLVEGLPEDSAEQKRRKSDILKIIENNPDIGKLRMVDNSWINKGYGTSAQDGGMYAATFISEGEDMYVSYRGTDNANWQYNDVAFGTGEDSELQTHAKEYFEKTVKREFEGKSRRDLYVTGHSQGGNNAMFVSMFAEGAEYIKKCYSFDGQGFASEVMERAKNLWGEAHYDLQVKKMFGYYGENDYVHQQGEEHPMPEGHIAFISTPKAKDFAAYHQSEFLIGEHGLNPPAAEGDLSKLVTKLVEKVNKLPQDIRHDSAVTVMALLEIKTGTGESDKINAESFEKLKKEVINILVDIAKENPELTAGVLAEILADDSSAYKPLLVLVNEFNELSRWNRVRGFENIFKNVVYKDGDLVNDINGWSAIAWIPAAIEIAIQHPGEFLPIIQAMGVDKMIGKWICDNPLQFAAGLAAAAVLVRVFPIIVPIAAGLAVSIALFEEIVEAVAKVAEGVGELIGKAKEKVLSIATAVKDLFNAIGTWLRDNFDRGYRFASDNTYMKAETDRLVYYQDRLASINRRLRSLDSEMDSLYFQVGLLDLFDILCANMLTGGSASLTATANWLGSASTRLIKAESRARSILGG